MNPNLGSPVRRGDELERMTFPPLQWAVQGVIPEGFGILAGPPKIGKSWLVYDVALAVSSGTRAFGIADPGPQREVLYLALEDSERRLQARARALLGAGMRIPTEFNYVIDVQPSHAPDLIADWLGNVKTKSPVVLMDTLGRLLPPALPGETQYQRDYRIAALFKSLADGKPGATVLAVHHTRKAAAIDWMDGTSGTNGLNGGADFTMNLERSRGNDCALLRITGRDVPDSAFAMNFERSRWVLDGTDLSDAARRAADHAVARAVGGRSAEIASYVQTHPGGTTPQQVDAHFHTSDARVYLKRLCDEGHLVKIRRGVYGPVTSVTS
ncbi:AAA family ATPase [Demequina sp. SYSU T00192]|uniref:AAA family ATPase n=1 Tax=Demequina litoralis TaxID=3051660 RepID=A0ABT8G670_9MICO|nr:AAA family ATPase [Demequina sp. SYSU T00192]MDN4474635.1 AAA family ATPase [Demequina sp. SYSU T00192]